MNKYLNCLHMHCMPNKYLKWHDNIIGKALSEQRKKCKYDGYEKHHILPRSFGGDNTKENYVLLSAREHFLIHVLLLKVLSNKEFYNKMLFALFNMKASNSLYKRNNTSRSYGKYKQEWQELQSARQKQNMSDPLFKQRVIEARAKTLKDNPDIAAKISQKLKGRVRNNLKKDILMLKGDERTDAQKLASKIHSEKLKGRPAWNKGKQGVGRAVKTPEGIFRTGLEASKHYNITTGTLHNRCKKKLYGFEFYDDKNN